MTTDPDEISAIRGIIAGLALSGVMWALLMYTALPPKQAFILFICMLCVTVGLFELRLGQIADAVFYILGGVLGWIVFGVGISAN